MIAWLTCLALFAAPPELPPETQPPVEAPPPAEAPTQPPVDEAPIEVAAPVVVEPQPVPQGDPNAKPPPHDARPSEGVYAVGSGPVTPLPPPPPPVPVSAIPKLDWRGTAWLSLRLTVTGPIGGDYPAKSSVVSLGGALEGGWRINQVAALGMGLSRQPHEVIRQISAFDGSAIVRRGTMTAWDLAFLRLYAPVRGRVDPYIDLGGGLAFVDPAREGMPLEWGGMARGGVGFDVWVAKNLTIGMSGLYRAAFLRDSIGHSVQGAIEVAVHF